DPDRQCAYGGRALPVVERPTRRGHRTCPGPARCRCPRRPRRRRRGEQRSGEHAGGGTPCRALRPCRRRARDSGCTRRAAHGDVRRGVGPAAHRRHRLARTRQARRPRRVEARHHRACRHRRPGRSARPRSPASTGVAGRERVRRRRGRPRRRARRRQARPRSIRRTSPAREGIRMTAAPTSTPTHTGTPTYDGVGSNASRPDGTLKVLGEFAYGSDLWMDNMLWGVTLRSPHPYARIVSIDIGPALATAGVHAVMTADDVPGSNRIGLELDDQPALADDIVRYEGEAVAIVAAAHPEIARQAAKRIDVTYDVLDPVTDARSALEPESPPLHEGGNMLRHLKIRKGDPSPSAPVVVKLDFEVGMQDQAFLGPESGMAIPADDGGRDLFVATQWLHTDQRQICAALGMPPDKVRLSLAGVGGAFGGREDLSMHVHACLLAMHT